MGPCPGGGDDRIRMVVAHGRRRRAGPRNGADPASDAPTGRAEARWPIAGQGQHVDEGFLVLLHARLPAEQLRPPAGAESAVAIVGVSLADDQYDAAVADLERALKQGRGKLDQATIAVVEQNLQTIDQAIAQAREALASDPANSYLSGHLVEARRRKLDLLRRATALTDMD